MTLDGKIATSQGDSQWITAPLVRQHAHRLRNSVDAILVGTRTALLDNPRLTVRDETLSFQRTPLKVVIDKDGTIPPTHRLFQERPENVIVVINPTYPPQKRLIMAQKGVTFLPMESSPHMFEPEDLLDKLYALGVTRLLIEGGAKTQACFLRAGSINRFYCYIAPQILGGVGSLSPFSDNWDVAKIYEAIPLTFDTCRFIDNAILITSRRGNQGTQGDQGPHSHVRNTGCFQAL
jgi:diaminohydroxyphosphoribosylaminopyrimidine deaminase/5-amino-6-(5-phosphoribosylamino)uracil reductase